MKALLKLHMMYVSSHLSMKLYIFKNPWIKTEMCILTTDKTMLLLYVEPPFGLCDKLTHGR